MKFLLLFLCTLLFVNVKALNGNEHHSTITSVAPGSKTRELRENQDVAANLRGGKDGQLILHDKIEKNEYIADIKVEMEDIDNLGGPVSRTATGNCGN